MDKSSSRALIFRDDHKVYLVIHNYVNPKNYGKWSTVGGRREKNDSSDLECLKREIQEEFGEQLLVGLANFEKAGSFTKKCEINEKDSVTHHFFYCCLKEGMNISPNMHQNEVFQGRFFDRKEVQQLQKHHNFVLGCEADLIEGYFKNLGEHSTSEL